MDKPELVRILEAAVNNDAEDILLLPGVRVLIRLEKWRELMTPPLTAEDVDSLARELLDSWQPQKCEGYCCQIFWYRGEVPFTAYAIGYPTTRALLLYRWPPEHEKRDDVRDGPSGGGPDRPTDDDPNSPVPASPKPTPDEAKAARSWPPARGEE